MLKMLNVLFMYKFVKFEAVWYLYMLIVHSSILDKTLGDSDLADWTQHPSLSGGSLLSDEGLELSFVSKGKLFTGPELDSNSEEIVRGMHNYYVVFLIYLHDHNSIYIQFKQFSKT